MSISYCNCYFDYYLLKINRDQEFLKNVKSLNSEDWPKILLKDPSFPKSKGKLVRNRWPVLDKSGQKLHHLRVGTVKYQIYYFMPAERVHVSY